MPRIVDYWLRLCSVLEEFTDLGLKRHQINIVFIFTFQARSRFLRVPASPFLSSSSLFPSSSSESSTIRTFVCFPFRKMPFGCPSPEPWAFPLAFAIRVFVIVLRYNRRQNKQRGVQRRQRRGDIELPVGSSGNLMATPVIPPLETDSSWQRHDER